MFMKFYEVKESTSLVKFPFQSHTYWQEYFSKHCLCQFNVGQICRNSNRIEGCSHKDCSFVHSHTPSKITRTSQRVIFLPIPKPPPLPPPPSSPDLNLPYVFKRTLFYTSLPGSATLRLSFSRFLSGQGFLCLSSRIPVEPINKLGDWYSDAVLLYLTVPLPIRLQSVHLFTKAITSH